MKKEKVLKVMLVLIMGVILVAMTSSVYALSDDEFLDITDTVDTNTLVDDTEEDSGEDILTGEDEGENTTIDFTTDDKEANTNVNANVNANANYNTNLPEAGVAENTMLGVIVTVLVITAVFAYRKVKYYKNI